MQDAGTLSEPVPMIIADSKVICRPRRNDIKVRIAIKYYT